MLRPCTALLFTLALVAPAVAKPPPPPPAHAVDDADREIAQRHFRAALALYDAHDYRGALVELEAARKVAPLPAFDYNIGRCWDRLEEPQRAVEAYRRYLASAPADAAQVRARVEALELRYAPAPSVAPAPVPAVTAAPPPPRRSGYAAPAAVGVVALAVLGTGAGLLGYAGARYHTLETTCSPACDRASWADLPAFEHAGTALLAVGGALAVADIVLFAVLPRRARAQALVGGGRTLAFGWSF